MKTASVVLGVQASLLYMLVSIPRHVAACDGVCCEVQDPFIRIVGRVGGGVLAAVEVPSCSAASEEQGVRKVDVRPYAVFLRGGRTPDIVTAPIPGSVRYLRPHEVLFYLTSEKGNNQRLSSVLSPASAKAKSQQDLDHAISPLKSAEIDITRGPQGLLLRDRTAARNLILFHPEGECEVYVTQEIADVQTSDELPFFIAIQKKKCEPGCDCWNYTWHQLDFIAWPRAIDVKVFDGTRAAAGSPMAAAVATAVSKLKTGGFHTVEVQPAKETHERTKLMVRRLPYPKELTAPYPAYPPVSAEYYYVAALLRAQEALIGDGLVLQAGDQETDPILLAKLDWNEPADLVVILGNDIAKLARPTK